MISSAISSTFGKPFAGLWGWNMQSGMVKIISWWMLIWTQQLVHHRIHSDCSFIPSWGAPQLPVAVLLPVGPELPVVLPWSCQLHSASFSYIQLIAFGFQRKIPKTSSITPNHIPNIQHHSNLSPLFLKKCISMRSWASTRSHSAIPEPANHCGSNKWPAILPETSWNVDNW